MNVSWRTLTFDLGSPSYQHVRPGINRLIRVGADLHNAGSVPPVSDSSS